MTDIITSNSAGQLRSIVERIERLEEDRKTVAADIKEVYAEAKGNGYDTKIIRKVVVRRARDAAQLAEEEALFDIYLRAVNGDLLAA